MFKFKNVTLKVAFFNSFFLNFYRNGVLSFIFHHKSLIIKDGIFQYPLFIYFMR